MNFYILVLFSTILYVAGDFFAKSWAVKTGWHLISASLFFYAVASLFFIFAIKKSSLSIAVGAMPLATVIAGIVFAYFYFDERLSTIQYLGVALGIVSLFLIIFPFEAFQK